MYPGRIPSYILLREPYPVKAGSLGLERRRWANIRQRKSDRPIVTLVTDGSIRTDLLSPIPDKLVSIATAESPKRRLIIPWVGSGAARWDPLR